MFQQLLLQSSDSLAQVQTVRDPDHGGLVDNMNLDILLETKYQNIRASVDHKTTTGFEVCAFATTYMPYLSVRLSWTANENVIIVCDEAEYRCLSGECIKRDTICDAYRDCLSGDDETSEVCADAMSQLAFATFSTTVMLTYLVTYMKYIKGLADRFYLRPSFTDPLPFGQSVSVETGTCQP